LEKLNQQTNQKDMIIQKLNLEIHELRTLLENSEKLMGSPEITSFNQTSADIILAQNEMTNFWVMLGFKTLLVIGVFSVGYCLYKGFTIVSIFKMPVYAITAITNRITGGYWFTGNNKFYFDKNTGSDWMIKLADENVIAILVRLNDSRRFIPVSELINTNTAIIKMIENAVNQTAIVAANPQTQEVITSATDALFQTIT
jgi:hypothetical protein